jgi:hypothetical protein
MYTGSCDGKGGSPGNGSQVEMGFQGSRSNRYTSRFLPFSESRINRYTSRILQGDAHKSESGNQPLYHMIRASQSTTPISISAFRPEQSRFELKLLVSNPEPWQCSPVHPYALNQPLACLSASTHA